MAHELEPHTESKDTSTDMNEALHPDGQPMTYERDSARAEAMAYAEDEGRAASKRFAKLALKAADNIEAGNTQPVSYKHEYEWDPPFSGYRTEWSGVEGNYDESDKTALAAIVKYHPNREDFSSDDSAAKENSKIELNHEEIADAAVEYARGETELASRASELAGERYDEKKQEAVKKANDVRSRIARL